MVLSFCESIIFKVFTLIQIPSTFFQMVPIENKTLLVQVPTGD